jgi:hypothetical protein
LPKVVDGLKDSDLLDGQLKSPHFSSIINWCVQVGLGLLRHVKKQRHDWVAILDHSIDIGTKKVLVVLRVPLDVLQKRHQAITLEDCECIGLRVNEDTTSEKVADDLKIIFDQAGEPAVIIKDGAANLNKGVALWKADARAKTDVVGDIGHYIGNAAKHHFTKDTRFQQFTTALDRCSKRLRQTRFAFLLPPKLSAKGRFLGLSCLAGWAQNVLKVLKQKGTKEHAEARKALKKALPDLPQLQSFMDQFSCVIDDVGQIQEILKNNGLNRKTARACRTLTKKLPSKLRAEINAWLDTHIAIYKKRSATSLPVSSDIIESLFGSFKAIIERSPYTDISQSVLLIPVLCGRRPITEIETILTLTKYKDVQSWAADNIPYTIRRKRRAFFSSLKSAKS